MKNLKEKTLSGIIRMVYADRVDCRIWAATFSGPGGQSRITLP